MKKRNEMKLGEALKELISVYRLDEKLGDVKIIAAWKNTLGPMINKHTLELKVNHGKLFVKLDSPALKKELLMGRSQLIQNLNREVGQEVIHEIVFL